MPLRNLIPDGARQSVSRSSDRHRKCCRDSASAGADKCRKMPFEFQAGGQASLTAKPGGAQNMPSAPCSSHGKPSASIHRSRRPGNNTSADEILTENLCDTFFVSGSFRAETRREYSARNSSGCCPTVVTKATHASSGPSHSRHTLHFRNNYCSTVFCRLQVIRTKFTADLRYLNCYLF